MKKVFIAMALVATAILSSCGAEEKSEVNTYEEVLEVQEEVDELNLEIEELEEAEQELEELGDEIDNI